MPCEAGLLFHQEMRVEDSVGGTFDRLVDMYDNCECLISSLTGSLTFARYLLHLKAIRDRKRRCTTLLVGAGLRRMSDNELKCHLPFLGISTDLRSTVFTEAIFLIGGIYWKFESWRILLVVSEG